MKPKCFLYKDVPYNDMWVDDKYWLPQEMLSKDINIVKELTM